MILRLFFINKKSILSQIILILIGYYINKIIINKIISTYLIFKYLYNQLLIRINQIIFNNFIYFTISFV